MDAMGIVMQFNSFSRFARDGCDGHCDAIQFLGPRELYHTAFACKDRLQFVTVQLVVRSALLNGRTLGGKAIEELYPLVQHKSIHPVSPLRLCECCVRENYPSSVWCCALL